MITIIVDTAEEYDRMMEVAYAHICRQLPFTVCGKYKPNTCPKCYKDNHLKCGIRVVRVDNEEPNLL